MNSIRILKFSCGSLVHRHTFAVQVQRWKDPKFKDSMGYTAGPCLRKENSQQKKGKQNKNGQGAASALPKAALVSIPLISAGSSFVTSSFH